MTRCRSAETSKHRQTHTHTWFLGTTHTRFLGTLANVRRPCLGLCRGFPLLKCIVLKHLSREEEETPLGSQSPPAKRSCPDLQVKTRTKPTWTSAWVYCGYLSSNVCLDVQPFCFLSNCLMTSLINHQHCPCFDHCSPPPAPPHPAG